MREKDKTGEQLRNELAALRQRIADLEAAETRCQQAEELFKALFSSSTSGAYIIQDGKLQVINSAYQKITGYSTDELLGADPSPLVPAEDRSAVRENFIAILKGKRFSPCEHRFVNKAGEVGWVVETVIPIQYQGRRAVLGNFMDITVHKQADAALRKAHDELEIRVQQRTAELTRANEKLQMEITKRKKTEESLRRSEEYFHSIIENSTDMVIILNGDGTIRYTSPSVERILGYKEEELSGKSAFEFLPPEDVTSTINDFHQAIQNPGVTLSPKLRIRHKDGSVRIVEGKGRNLLNNPAVAGIVLNFRDMTKRRQAEKALRESEEKYRALFEESRDVIFIVSRDGSILDINQYGLELFGYTREEMTGMNAQEVYGNPVDRERYQQEIEKKGFVRDYEVKLRKKDGTEMDCLITSTVRHDADGNILGYQGIVRDVTERKRQEQQLAFMATHDLLTGLPNRRLFTDRLALALVQARRHQQKVTVMMLDLDRFKDINDTLGHDVGDQLLQSVGNRLISLLRKSDTTARLGGDEFMLLLPEISGGKDTARIARKVLEDFHQPFVFGDRNIHITTSIGIALYPDHGEDSDTLMKKADIALYRAKELGRNNYQCCPEAMPPQALE